MVGRGSLIGFGSAAVLGGYYLYTEYAGCTYSGTEKLDGQTFILTGATSQGVGKETARELAKRGARVILAAKNQDRCHVARQQIMHSTQFRNQNVECAYLDLKSLKSVRKFVNELPTDTQISGVINAAETVKKKEREETKDGLEKQMGVSHFGHFLLNELLVEKFGRQSQPFRIAQLTYPAKTNSLRLLNLNDLNSTGHYDRDAVYKQAKLASLLTVYEAARRLSPAGRVTVNAVDPGFCNTEVFRHVAGDQSFIVKVAMQPILRFLFPSPEKACQSVLYAVLSPDLAGVSGQYVEQCRVKDLPIPSSEKQQVDQTAGKLWEMTQMILADPARYVQSERKRAEEAQFPGSLD